MSVTIRFARGGRKKLPFFRLVAADKRMKRDGRFLEKLGTWDPRKKEGSYSKEALEAWVKKGAQISDSVKQVLAQLNGEKTEKKKVKNTKSASADSKKKEAVDMKEEESSDAKAAENNDKAEGKTEESSQAK